MDNPTPLEDRLRNTSVEVGANLRRYVDRVATDLGYRVEPTTTAAARRRSSWLRGVAAELAVEDLRPDQVLALRAWALRTSDLLPAPPSSSPQHQRRAAGFAAGD